MGNGDLFLLLLSCLVHFKLMGFIPNGFGLFYNRGLPITLRISNGVIGEQFIGTFRVDRLGWSLGLRINGNMR